MATTPEHDARVAALTFASVYPHYVTKVEKKGRSLDELHQVLHWLTGFDVDRLREMIDRKVTFKEFFEEATVHPNATLITGSICGYKIQEIETKLTRECRYMDKLVDELAKGKKMEKILRTQ
jgi:hypothetical protein